MTEAAPDGFRCRSGAEPLATRLFATWPAQAEDHAVLLIDAAATIVGTNPAADSLFAAGAGALLGLPASAIFTERDRGLGLDRQEFAVADRLGASEDDRWHLRRDGTLFWSLGTLRAIRSEAGDRVGYVKMIRDRTDLRAQMDATAHRLAVAEAALAAATQRLATVGHELRGPLGAISNAATALRQPALAAASGDRLHAILERQMEIASRLLRDVVDGSGGAPAAFELRPTVLQHVLESAAGAVRGSDVCRDRTIELIVPDAPLRLETDPVRLEQVFRNLIDNGCKYGRAGGHVWVTATLEAESAVVRVRDDGVGIANDVLPRIFDWFVRVAVPGDGAGPTGSGIGLGVVREFVRRLHGTVEVVSSGVHGGAEFTVNLPLRPPPPAVR
jgi:PAS domain S-box-containing protein